MDLDFRRYLVDLHAGAMLRIAWSSVGTEPSWKYGVPVFLMFRGERTLKTILSIPSLVTW